MSFTRRDFIRTLTQSWVGLSLLASRLGSAQALGSNIAERIIFFYWPNAVAPQDWHPIIDGSSWTLPLSTRPLEPFREQLNFFRNLRLAGPNEDGHSNGAMRLLTGKVDGKGISLDQYLAEALGAETAFSHIHLGIQASKDKNHSDPMISRYSGGLQKVPEDDPIAARQRLFPALRQQISQNTNPTVIRALLEEIEELQHQLGSLEQQKLAIHAQAIREIEKRETGGQCEPIEPSSFNGQIHQDSQVPLISRLQIETAVTALRCGLSRVASLQFASHTSNVVMDWSYLSGNNEKPSHNAAHNRPAEHALQVQWWMEQLAMLLQKLSDSPEPSGKGGSMLDHSLVVAVSEMADGQHINLPWGFKRNMPILVAGGRALRLPMGQVIDAQNASHGNLLTSLGRIMGLPLQNFGDDSTGPLSSFTL